VTTTHGRSATVLGAVWASAVLFVGCGDTPPTGDLKPPPVVDAVRANARYEARRWFIRSPELLRVSLSGISDELASPNWALQEFRIDQMELLIDDISAGGFEFSPQLKEAKATLKSLRERLDQLKKKRAEDAAAEAAPRGSG